MHRCAIVTRAPLQTYINFNPIMDKQLHAE